MSELLAFLVRLESECEPGRLREFVQVNHIGESPLAYSSKMMQGILKGMRESTRKMLS